MCVVIDNDKKKISKATSLYYVNASIDITESEERKKSDFYDFIDRDECQYLIMKKNADDHDDYSK